MNIDTLTSASTRYIGAQRRAPQIQSEPAPWAADALCLQFDAEIWYPPAGSGATEAKRICQQCPVRRECLELAISVPEGEFGMNYSRDAGIWGGMSERERRTLRKSGWRAGDPLPEVRIRDHTDPGTCPVCGGEFKSVRQHRASAHPGTRAA